MEWQPASQTRPSLGFGRRRFLKQKPVAFFCFFTSPEGQLPRRGILVIGAGPSDCFPPPSAALKGKFALFGGELHDFDVVGAMKKIIRRWNRACTGSRAVQLSIFLEANSRRGKPMGDQTARRVLHRIGWVEGGVAGVRKNHYILRKRTDLQKTMACTGWWGTDVSARGNTGLHGCSRREHGTRTTGLLARDRTARIQGRSGVHGTPKFPGLT